MMAVWLDLLVFVLQASVLLSGFCPAVGHAMWTCSEFPWYFGDFGFCFFFLSNSALLSSEGVNCSNCYFI